MSATSNASPASTSTASCDPTGCAPPTCEPKPVIPLPMPPSQAEQDAKLAAYAKALGHPVRVAILRLLIQQQSCICGQIVAQLPIAQSTVSQHLKVLKKAGLIRGTIDGPRICYCVDPAALDQFGVLLASLHEGAEVMDE